MPSSPCVCVGLAHREIAEVIDALAAQAAEQVVRRLPARLAAEVPQRHVDAGEREARGHRPEVPEAQGVDVVG